MLVSELPAVAAVHAADGLSRIANAVKPKIDNALVRYDAWFLVFVAVIIGLGAVLLAGMAIWCVVYKEKRFTGNWEFRNFGLKVFFECA